MYTSHHQDNNYTIQLLEMVAIWKSAKRKQIQTSSCFRESGINREQQESSKFQILVPTISHLLND